MMKIHCNNFSTHGFVLSIQSIYNEVQARRRRWRLSRKHFSKFFHMTFHENINDVRGWRLAFNVHAPQISDYHSVKR